MHRLTNWWTEQKLKERRWKMRKRFAERLEKIKDGTDKNPYAYPELQGDEYFEEQMMEEDRNGYLSHRLLLQADEYDVEVPPLSEKDLWRYTDDGENCYLTLKGRDLMRDRVNQAKDRNSADWARRSKIWVPIITAVAALLGAATGLVLAFKK